MGGLPPIMLSNLPTGVSKVKIEQYSNGAIKVTKKSDKAGATVSGSLTSSQKNSPEASSKIKIFNQP